MRHFEIGMKVVCINDKFDEWQKCLFLMFPVEGKTYVIRNVTLGTRLVKRANGFDKVGTIRLLLVGLDNPHTEGPANSQLTERGFDSDRFVPLDEVKDESANGQEQPDAIGRNVSVEVKKLVVATAFALMLLVSHAETLTNGFALVWRAPTNVPGRLPATSFAFWHGSNDTWQSLTNVGFRTNWQMLVVRPRGQLEHFGVSSVNDEFNIQTDPRLCQLYWPSPELTNVLVTWEGSNATLWVSLDLSGAWLGPFSPPGSNASFAPTNDQQFFRADRPLGIERQEGLAK